MAKPKHTIQIYTVGEGANTQKASKIQDNKKLEQERKAVGNEARKRRQVPV